VSPDKADKIADYIMKIHRKQERDAETIYSKAPVALVQSNKSPLAITFKYNYNISGTYRA
jgi:hypothetical protein